MAPLGEGPSSDLDGTFGALLIGVFFAIFLQGLLTIQTWNYYENFPSDKWRLKLLVCFVWILDTAHLVVICHSAYGYTVTNWGYKPALMAAAPELYIHIFMIGVACFLCQSFFIRRIWVFSKGNKLVLALAVAPSVANLVLNTHLPFLLIADNYTIPSLHIARPEVIALFFTGAASDVVITAFLCYYVRFNSGHSTFRITRTILGKVLQYVVITGLVTSALGIGAVIAVLIKPNNLYYIAMHLSLGRLYTNSLLATLNSRKKLREKLESGEGNSHSGTTRTTSRSVNIKIGSDGSEAIQTDLFQASSAFQSMATNTSDLRFAVDHVTHHDDGASDAGREVGSSIELDNIDKTKPFSPT